jgi:hypothetical protein
MDGLGIGIELDIFGIGDEGWPLAAEGCPEEQAAAKSASTPTPTAPPENSMVTSARLCHFAGNFEPSDDLATFRK